MNVFQTNNDIFKNVKTEQKKIDSFVTKFKFDDLEKN